MIATIGSRSRQQAYNASQAFPCRAVERRIRADEIADHIPRRDVESALRRRAHRQGDRALRAETYPLGRRFLARSYSYGLREHIDRNRFVSGFEFPITAKTIQVFQRSSRRAVAAKRKYCRQPSIIASMQKDSRGIVRK
jgi:hypothetical protein